MSGVTLERVIKRYGETQVIHGVDLEKIKAQMPDATKVTTAEVDEDTAKDAIFLSPHKFVGGPGTPGVLIVKKKLLTNRVPSVPGGGTVSYVSPAEHTYLTDHAHREEGGTPAIIEAIRAGLVFGLKDAVGPDVIRDREEELIERSLFALAQRTLEGIAVGEVGMIPLCGPA